MIQPGQASAFRIDWAPADLERLREQAWLRWIAYSAERRRVFAQEYHEICSTALGPWDDTAQPTKVVPDAYFPPGKRPPLYKPHEPPRPDPGRRVHWHYWGV